MAKKNKINLADLAGQLKQDVISGSETTKSGYVPDIIEFVESDKYLGLKKRGIELYPAQRVVLKTFYRGSIGNEHLTLTAEEQKICEELGLNDDHNGNVLGKYYSGDIFRELVLVWGRRSGKDFFASILALYEALKLIECPGGDPHKFYGLGDASTITILTIANAKEQAKIAYKEIAGKLHNSPYFRHRFIKEGVAKDGEIYLLTPHDIAENKERAQRGLAPRLGSILIQTGHSESTSLVGKGCFVVIFDEIGLYKNTSGPSSGEELYGALTPTVATYVRNEIATDKDGETIYDEHGKPAIKSVYDGKIICISSPRGEDGIFFKLYNNAANVKHRLMCRLPTWKVNPRQSEDGLLNEFPDMSPEKFNMEFGAEFSGTAGDNFFQKEDIENCFRKKDLKFKDIGLPNTIYYAHLDPASSSHNYALCICHKEYFYDTEQGRRDFCVVVDHIKFWSPKPGQPIISSVIDQEMIKFSRKFRFGIVTYDQWNSQNSIQNLRKHAVPCKELTFSPRNKVKIYDNLSELAMSGRLLIPDHPRLMKEMSNLQRKWLGHSTKYKVFPKADSDINTDDLVDALAGAVYNCIDHQVSKLPQGKLIDNIVSGTANQMPWRTMQGVMGYGTGQQVSKNLEDRSQAWKYRSGYQ